GRADRAAVSSVEPHVGLHGRQAGAFAERPNRGRQKRTRAVTGACTLSWTQNLWPISGCRRRSAPDYRILICAASSSHCKPDRRLCGCGSMRSVKSGDLALPVFDLVLDVLVVGEILGESDARDHFPEQFAGLADPHAVDAVLLDADDRKRLTSRFQEHNVSGL